MNKQQLLAEVEDLLRTMPSKEYFTQHHASVIPWVGRALAVIHRWSPQLAIPAEQAAGWVQMPGLVQNITGMEKLQTLLHRAQHDLRMEIGATNVLVEEGKVFDYFDEIRKLLETAREEVLFVDRYLNAEFVSRYLSHVAGGVTIRLLTQPKRVEALVSAVHAFVQQSGGIVQIRTSASVHDRFLFVDKRACYQSGASFKDGARKGPVTLTAITDAFQAMWDTYDQMWNGANSEL